jgi:hypothetical protein
MNQKIYQILVALIALLLGVSSAYGQKKDTTEFNLENVKIIITENGDTIKPKKKGLDGMRISIGNNGIKIGNPNKKKKHKKLHTGMHFDFGINNFIDNSKYSSLQPLTAGGQRPTNQSVVQDSILRPVNQNDLQLRNGKSINFNFWPVWLKQDVAKHNVQIETGLGFQFFNYRFSTNVRHSDAVPVNTTTLNPGTASIVGPGFEDVSDPARLQGKEKNKLGVSYVSVPLMLRFNSNKKKGHRYFVGAGVIGSYKLKSWTKFYGDKESGNYGINNWMTQLSAELGITGVIKLYGTYALQSMYENGLDRRPFAIGIRL